MEHDPMRLVQALLDADFATDKHDSPEVPKGPAIALSREYGCLGEEVAEALAQELGVKCYDKELIDAIARDAKVDKFLMKRLDERVTGLFDDWVYSTIWGQRGDKDEYRVHLANVLIGIASVGGVVIGRGAHLLITPAKVFRLRITGSPEVCALRVASSEGMSVTEARKKVARVNSERATFIRQTYQRDINDPSTFDLTLNTDRISPQGAVRIIIGAIKEAGFEWHNPHEHEHHHHHHHHHAGV